MKNILLCSSNPILLKNLYGALRDDGLAVDTVEHPSLAVKKVLWGKYDAVVVDSEPFGMTAKEAAQVIRSVAPGMPVIFMGEQDGTPGSSTIDLEQFKRTIHSIAV